MYVDAHCHLDDDAFADDRDAVFARARAAGVTGVVVAGVHPGTWPRQRALCADHPGARWTAGLHPAWVAGASPADIEAGLAALPAAFEGPDAASGLGETGLDARFVPKETLPRQADCFRRQLAIARDVDVPVVLHVIGPGTHARALEILRRDGLPKAGGMLHAYSGSAELVADYAALGLYFSFAGTIARPDARKVHRAAARVPDDRLLVETDAPDLSPPGLPRRNEPAALVQVAEAIAAQRGSTAREVLERGAGNARALFGIFDAT